MAHIISILFGYFLTRIYLLSLRDTSPTERLEELLPNPQLVQLLAQQEAFSRAACMEYECNQGDYNMMSWPDGTAYRPYQPYQTLAR